MKGNIEVIKQLNLILKNELMAVNEYFLHSRICKNWGFMKLANKLYHESIDEMKHADLLIERIIFLEGKPNLNDLHHIRIGETIPDMLKNDLSLETDTAIPALREAILVCDSAKDFGSRDILEKILKEEEGHAGWLETQIHLLDKMGLQNYLQSITLDTFQGLD
jgi:bacterioferritin